ncbi:MAG TPA: hypothetical protein VMZ04_00135 [Anaerolineae bacterium]|nr:hypothetical protein [Anaerolineae bacterium]
MEVLYSHNFMEKGENPYVFWSFYAFIGYLRFFSYLILLLGISCAVVGFVQFMKRYRFVVGTVAFLLLCFAFFIKLIPLFESFLTDLMNKQIRDFTHLYPQLSSILISLVDSLYPMLLGIACMYIGFFLFEKYSEV